MRRGYARRTELAATAIKRTEEHRMSTVTQTQPRRIRIRPQCGHRVSGVVVDGKERPAGMFTHGACEVSCAKALEAASPASEDR